MYKDRNDINLPKAPEGIEYRTLGTMERNVGIFAKRMKGVKSWSERGATNLSRIIALKMGKSIKAKVASLVSGKLSERLTERFEESLNNAKEVLEKRVKKSVYPIKHGLVPFTNCKVTNGRKAIRSMFNLKTFSEMV